MSDKYLPFAGLARLINSLETEHDIKVFLTKYKQWYIKEHHLSKLEAENRIKMDLKYFFNRFIKDEDLVNKISKIVHITYS